MATYIAWYGKKLEGLAQHEREFIDLLHSEPDATRLAEAAEEVRAAQIRALKAKRAQLVPSERNTRGFKNLEREIAFWLHVPVQTIIDGYRSEKLRGHRSAAVRRANG
jgi:hypothetical protein